jgi:hypothetical protein
VSSPKNGVNADFRMSRLPHLPLWRGLWYLLVSRKKPNTSH